MSRTMYRSVSRLNSKSSRRNKTRWRTTVNISIVNSSIENTINRPTGVVHS